MVAVAVVIAAGVRVARRDRAVHGGGGGLVDCLTRRRPASPRRRGVAAARQLRGSGASAEDDMTDLRLRCAAHGGHQPHKPKDVCGPSHGGAERAQLLWGSSAVVAGTDGARSAGRWQQGGTRAASPRGAARLPDSAGACWTEAGAQALRARVTAFRRRLRASQTPVRCRWAVFYKH